MHFSKQQEQKADSNLKIYCSLNEECSSRIIFVNTVLKEDQIPNHNMLNFNLYKEVTAWFSRTLENIANKDH